MAFLSSSGEPLPKRPSLTRYPPDFCRPAPGGWTARSTGRASARGLPSATVSPGVDASGKPTSLEEASEVSTPQDSGTSRVPTPQDSSSRERGGDSGSGGGSGPVRGVFPRASPRISSQTSAGIIPSEESPRSRCGRGREGASVDPEDSILEPVDISREDEGIRVVVVDMVVPSEPRDGSRVGGTGRERPGVPFPDRPPFFFRWPIPCRMAMAKMISQIKSPSSTGQPWGSVG